MAAKLNTKDHRQRKNPKSAEAYQKERRKRNEARPKQVVIIEQLPGGGEKITGPVRGGEFFSEPQL